MAAVGAALCWMSTTAKDEWLPFRVALWGLLGFHFDILRWLEEGAVVFHDPYRLDYRICRHLQNRGNMRLCSQSVNQPRH